MGKSELLEQLSIAAQRAYSRGIQTGSGGNLSARSENGKTMYVKSSGGSFADCDKNGAGFVETDFSGALVPGAAGKPTREVFLHGLLYRFDRIGGVMHCHSPWANAWSLGDSDVLPMTLLHVDLKFGCDIPILDIPTPMVLSADEDRILALFAANPKLPAFILKAHGVVAVGKDILEAEHNAELVEETAQVALLSKAVWGK